MSGKFKRHGAAEGDVDNLLALRVSTAWLGGALDIATVNTM